MPELEGLIASRTFLTGMLAAVGLAIAFGPELRLALGRLRREDRDASEAAPRVGAGAG